MGEIVHFEVGNGLFLRIFEKKNSKTHGKTQGFEKSKTQFAENMSKQVKPGFTNYQPQPQYSWALSEIEGKGKLTKTKDL